VCNADKSLNEIFKYQHEPIHPDDFYMHEAAELVYNHLAQFVEEVDVLSHDETVATFDFSTSPGYPWKKYGSKQDIFNEHVDEVLAYWYAPEGEVYWSGFPKLEPLPKEKAIQKTRLITGSPIHLTYVFRRLFANLDEQIVENYGKLHTAVGVSLFHRSWHQLMQQFENGLVDEVDASRWDARVTNLEFQLVSWIRWQFLKDKSPINARRVQWIFEQTYDSKVLMFTGDVYRVKGGMKSGWPATSVDNSLINLIRLAYSWLRMGYDREDFHSFPMAVYGDDLLTGSLPEQFWDYYQEAGTQIDTHKKLGIPLEGASFLSQTVAKRKGIWVAIPKGPRLLYSAAFAEGKETQRNGLTRLLSLALCGFWTEDFDELYSWYKDWCLVYGMTPYARNWFESQWLSYELDGGRYKNGSNQEEVKSVPFEWCCQWTSGQTFG
jgi:hypothetical protein